MAYTTDLARLLADQLERFVPLQRHQLAGHVANLDFWVGEARHALEVIDGYGPRFELLKGAQKAYTARFQPGACDPEDPRQIRAPVAPPRRVPAEEFVEARRAVCDGLRLFLARCVREGLIDEAAMRRACDPLGIGIDANDLRR